MIKSQKKNSLFLILLLSIFLVLNFPIFVSAESEDNSVEATSSVSDVSTSDKNLSQNLEDNKSLASEEASKNNQSPDNKDLDLVENSQETPDYKSEENDLSEEDKNLSENSDSKEDLQDNHEDDPVLKDKSEQDQALASEESDLTDKSQDPAEEASQDKSQENTSAETDAASENPDLKLDENTEEDKILKEGESLDVSSLSKNPMTFGAGPEDSENTIVKVRTFDQLKKAIADAGNKKTTIKIMESFTLTETLTIGENQDIILTADNTREEESWEPIKRPADFSNQGEAKQREIIEEGRKRGEEALEKADLDKNPLPSETLGDKIIKRADDFINETLFNVKGKLTLGTEDSALYIDGNGDKARTELSDSGTVIDVIGELTMKNAVIMNSYNKHGYTGPIRVNKGGKFNMEGGRISKNTSYEQIDPQYSRPYAAGAVFVQPGGSFTMTNGLIDNNIGGLTGGIFAGDLSGSKGAPAIVNIRGGIIAKNTTKTIYEMGGGLAGFPASKITITDGIIAGNYSEDTGGGIGISSQYIGSPSYVLGAEKASVNTNYENFIKENKAEAFIDGGLIYKNKSIGDGGGIYVDSNDVHFGKTMILDNHSSSHGGGIYISFPPITQKLEHILITENKAEGYTDTHLGGSNGGGIWNCPTGYVHIGDGHSVYTYNNNAGSYGQDITFVKKAWNFKLNGKRVGGEFYSHISPVTEWDNIIKYVEDGRGREYDETIPGHLSYHNTYTYLKTIYNKALIKEAWENSETFVLGNRGRNGGGLGSNANLITEDKGDYQIEFNKKWDESVDKYHAPREVWVDLFIVPLDKDGDYVKANYGKDNNLFKYGEIIIREKDNWYARFGTNNYNGANKDKVLEMLGIKSFTDIGLPENAFNMDKGLPFTADELAEKGYKYLAVEQGTGYFVEVTEEKPTKDKMVQAGVLEITRKYDDPYYDDENVRKDKDLYFYLYDPDKQVFTRLGKSTIHEGETTPDFGKTTFAHPLLLKEISKYKHYGKDRVFTEYGWEDEFGYFNEDKGYAIILTENKDGTLTVELPYLWYSYEDNLGFSAKQLEETVDYEIKGNSAHSFTLTNSNWGQLDVEKSWANIEEKDQPKSMDFYLLLDGKRIVDGYDENGKPIYKKLTLKAEDGWKGTFKKLNPKALSAGKYTLEEDSDIFAPEFVNKKEKFIIRIGYADYYREEGMAENQITSTNNHFPSENYKNEDGTYRDVKLNLYLDGEKVQEGVFHFTVRKNPITGAPYAELKKTFAFDAVEVETYGQGIPVKYYDVISNETGRDEYNFYIKKDEHGAYALYLPSLFYKGVSYSDLFIAESLEYNERYDRYDKVTFVNPLKADVDWQIKTENHYGPNHNIEFLKKWIDGDNQIPDEITLILTDADGNKQEIKITKEDDWKKVLENLKGTLRYKGYSITEVEIPGFTGEIKTEKSGLKVTGKDKDGKEVSFNYMTDELKKVLEKGNYRYEVFELDDEDKDLEFNLENIDSFIKIEKQNDGRYIIRYAKDITLTELFTVNVENTYKPPEKPPEEPPEEPKNPPEKPEEPPEEPPETPELPPEEVPEEPMEIPEVPAKEVPRNPLEAPKTGVNGNEIYVFFIVVSLLGLYLIKTKKKYN